MVQKGYGKITVALEFVFPTDNEYEILATKFFLTVGKTKIT